jgi:hypothetical protein
VPLPVLLARSAQLRAAAVDFVAGQEGERHAGPDRAGDHLSALPGIGGERHLTGNGCPLAPVTVLAPRPGQVEPEVERRVATAGHIRHEHDGLAVLDLPGDPGVLAGHPDGHLALLQLSGLIQHQDRCGSAKWSRMNRCSAPSAAFQSQACSASRPASAAA